MRVLPTVIIVVFLALASTPVPAAVQQALLQVQEGGAALLRGNYAKALSHYNEALKSTGLPESRRATVLNDRGVAKWRLARRKEAIEDFNKAVELYPEYASAYKQSRECSP